MKRFLLIVFLSLSIFSNAQTPVPMATQPALTYLETFDSINTWANNFVSGTGAERFASVAIGGTATIPDATKITTNSGSFVTSQMSAGGLYKDTVNGRLIMLVTGTADNTNSIAIDLFLDFTGINAGTVSFDWETIFNGTPMSNRTGTLKVYASTNGSSFTELTAAEVTITNNIAANGSITNVSLPASFNSSSTARLRFYYYNSAGGSTGSRPAIALENIAVTASGIPCVFPTAAPTNLSFSNVTATSVQGNFTAANPAPDEYLVVVTSQGVLTFNPADSSAYNLGDNVGDGIVIYRGNGTSFTASNLNPLTTYTFYIFSTNIYCNGIIRYLSSNPLTGVQVTPAGPPCPVPTQQPTNLQFSNVTTTSVNGNFIASPDASEYVVVRSTNSSLGANPINTTIYNAGDAIGNGTVIYRGGATNFTATNLVHSTAYYFFVYSINNFACSGGPVYLTTAPLTASQNTNILLPCAAPFEEVANLILQPDISNITGFFDPGNPYTDGFLVVVSQATTLSALPQNGMIYNSGNTLGGGTIISTGKNYSFYANNLSAATNYNFFIFPYNEICIGGPIYKTINFLQGNTSTTSSSSLNYYFGNLHSHSSYSDGNQDDDTKIPTDDYDFAKNAMCMDFLGISDHNHYTASNNPGMTLAAYSQGLAQATNYTNANPGFLALYGMEWGTLTNGGHALVYGIDSLIGWETIGGNPNYNIYVPKNDFTSAQGLFSKVNSFNNFNAFTTLAHSSFNDYQGIAYNPYNASADSAITGIALESGPAFSANISYGEQGSNMEFLPYYLQMLSKGYHVAPMIDHDNHNLTFGRTATTRTAVIASSISKNDFLQAIRNMSFYATQDCNTKANIKIYGQQMGSIMTHSFAPAITITTENIVSSATPIIRLMYGMPGSGIAPIQLTSVTGYVLNYTDASLLQNNSAYYYADISYSSKRTITAPIWYTRSVDPPLSVEEISGNSSPLAIINNPAFETLNIELEAKSNCKIAWTIYSMYGQKLLSKTLFVTHGKQVVTISISSLPQGMYVIETAMGGEKIRKKFIHL